jgi:short-subunit dehydrogenase
MAKLDFKGKWVMVTGASSGLGREIARYLAKNEGANLVVVARRKERLESLKHELESTHPVKVKVLASDLESAQGVDLLFKKATDITEIFALVNNAGITFYGKAIESELPTFEKILRLNLWTVVQLSLKFLTYFQERGDGAILNITSEAAFVPLPYQSVYSASKHAIQAFTEGLHMEYRKSGVVISSFAPGGIATEMLSLSNLDKKHPMESPFNMKPEAVAKKAIKSFKKKKLVSVPGVLNKSTVFLLRFLPRKLIARISEKLYRPE